jgi:undecaprenyl-diphosphatase
MTFVESVFLGIIQGVTEFLPVSSDGHLQIGSAIVGMTDPSQNLGFTVLVHVATVLASLIVFRKEVLWLVKGVLKFSWNEETKYFSLIVLSTIPVIIVGLFFEDEVEQLFGANLTLTGAMLLVTAALLIFSGFAKSGKKEVGPKEAVVMGLGQALAVLPGLSRSGTTISTALVMGVDREKATRFSFLMVIIPILGKAALDLKDLLFGDDVTKMAVSTTQAIGTAELVTAFITSFIVGIIACSLLVTIVKKNKFHWFGFYCIVVGIIAILVGEGIISSAVK